MKNTAFFLILSVLIVGCCLLTLVLYTAQDGIPGFSEQKEPAVDEVCTLNFIHWNSFPKSSFKSFSREYPNIRVEFEQFDIQQFPEVQRARISSGFGIDLMGVVENDYVKFSDRGYLADITGKPFLKNYRPEVIKAIADMRNDGRIYAVAYKSWVLGIWYNKILFGKYFLNVPESYPEFLDVCAAFKKNGVSPMVLGCRDEWMSGYIYALTLWSAAGDDPEWFRKLGTGELKWTDASIRDAFRRSDNFIKKGYLLEDSINLTYHQAFSEFINGRAAMCLMGDGSVDLCGPGTEKVCDLGVFSIPYNLSGSSRMVPGMRAGMLTGIYAHSPHIDEAKLLLEYLSRPDTAKEYAAKTQSSSTVAGVSNNINKYDKLWEPLSQNGLITPITSVLDLEVQRRFNKSGRELILKLKTVDTILKELKQLQSDINRKRGTVP